jgi:hypothetical protein
VKAVTRNIEILDSLSRIKSGQLHAKLFRVLGLDSRLRPFGVELLEAFVPE